jgi:hypothetical protein
MPCLPFFVEINVLQSRYADEMRKIHGPDVDWRNAPLDADAAYQAGGGLPHGRSAMIMIV